MRTGLIFLSAIFVSAAQIQAASCPPSINLSTALASGDYTCTSSVGDLQFSFAHDLLTQYIGADVTVLGTATPLANPANLQLLFSGDSVNIAPTTGNFSASAGGVLGGVSTAMALLQFNVQAAPGYNLTGTTLQLNNVSSTTGGLTGQLLANTNLLGVEMVCAGGPFSTIVGGTVSAILANAQAGCSGLQVGATEALNNGLTNDLSHILGLNGINAGVNASVILGSPATNSVGIIKLESLTADAPPLGSAAVSDSSFGDSFTTSVVQTSATPEPSQFLPMALGLACILTGIRWKKGPRRPA